MAAARAGASGAFGNGVSSLTISSFTVSGSDTVLVVCPASNDDATNQPSSITWNTSENLTSRLTATQDSFYATGLWDLVAPTATTANIVCNWGSTVDGPAVSCMLLTGVDQTTPRGSSDTDSGASATSNNALTLTSVDNDDLIVSVLSITQNNSGTVSGLTAGGTGHTKESTYESDVGPFNKDYNILTAMSYLAGNQDDDPNWTWTNSANWMNCAQTYKAASAATAYTLSCDSGTFSVSGTAASLLASYEINAESGSYPVTGTAASLEYSRTLSAESTAYSVAGTDASLLAGYSISSESGAYTVSGANAGLIADYTVNAESSAYTFTGTDASFQIGKIVSAESGTYSVSGQDVGFTVNYVLSAEGDSYSITGQAAGLEASYVLTADSDSYTITGTDVSLLTGYSVSSESGVYSVAGTDASLLRTLVVSSESGTYTITGTDATLVYTPAGSYSLTANSASYSVSGQNVTFLLNSVISAESGTFSASGQDATLSYNTNVEEEVISDQPSGAGGEWIEDRIKHINAKKLSDEEKKKQLQSIAEDLPPGLTFSDIAKDIIEVPTDDGSTMKLAIEDYINSLTSVSSFEQPMKEVEVDESILIGKELDKRMVARLIVLLMEA